MYNARKQTMKKIIYSMSMAAALLFTACSEHRSTTDRGTTYEVADANKDEVVDPTQIRQYPLPGTAGNATASNNTSTDNATSNLTATQLVIAYYDSVNPVRAYRSQNYKFSSTKLMGGKAAAAGMSTNTNKTNMDSATTRTPGSTTAQGESRNAVGNQKTGNDKIRVTDSKKKPVDTGNKTKKRLTPDQ
jgi:hypothetical protein